MIMPSENWNMFLERKPSLRYFAVIRRDLRSFRGSIWEVRDRRNPTRQQCLFLPSRVNSWPIWLNRLANFAPTPIRLRNGKVALLLNGSDLESVRACLRRRTKVSNLELDVMTGFQTTRAKRKKLQLVLLPTIAVLVSTFLLMPRDESVATPTPQRSTIAPKVDSCNVTVNRGVEISGTLSRYESIEITGQKYKIAEINKLGGLAQIKAKRTCDKKYFRFDAWLDEKDSRIERVY